MTTPFLMLAASLLRLIDPYTSVYQTDSPAEAAQLMAEPGYWPVPNGLVDPLAKKLEPRVIHTCFRRSVLPFAGYDPDVPTPLFKVNQVGYQPNAPKFAYMGQWLGPVFGAWKPRKPMTCWQLVDAVTRKSVMISSTPPVLRVRDGFTKEGVPFTGEETYEMDFSSFNQEGEYFIRVPGVGRSETFRIAADSTLAAFRLHMLGLYQKRCGIAKEEPYTHWTSGACHTNVVRGSFPPEEGVFEPKKVRHFDIIRDNTPWDGGEWITLSGGWHDAADYDRRPEHFTVVNDLCAVYLMRPENFRDGQLLIPERDNGIPDILDEAEWGLRHLLAAQQKDGGVGTWIETTAHPVPGNVVDRDTMRYAISRATRRSSMMYAAHASMLARCHDSFKAKYLESAKKAWVFALSTMPKSDLFEVRRRHHRFFTKTETYVWDEDDALPSSSFVKAAVNLHALTGDKVYMKALDNAMPRLLDDVKRNAWNWTPLMFSGEMALGTPKELQEFFARWESRTMNVARDIRRQVDESYAYRAPWWAPQTGWCNSMSWGQSHPLRRAQYLIAAHGMTKDQSFLDAAYLANDFHNGCNPQGTTLTSGLGRVYPVAFLDLPSYVDGIAEYVPGITPYRWNFGIPHMVIDMVFHGDKARAIKWPIWRRWGNLENQTVAASEYTVWETIAPAASVTGYLVDPAARRDTPLRQPATDITTLPGYWQLP